MLAPENCKCHSCISRQVSFFYFKDDSTRFYSRYYPYLHAVIHCRLVILLPSMSHEMSCWCGEKYSSINKGSSVCVWSRCQLPLVVAWKWHSSSQHGLLLWLDGFCQLGRNPTRVQVWTSRILTVSILTVSIQERHSPYHWEVSITGLGAA
jgi:hypothetical protein